jgi:hypothetical protein
LASLEIAIGAQPSAVSKLYGPGANEYQSSLHNYSKSLVADMLTA